MIIQDKGYTSNMDIKLLYNGNIVNIQINLNITVPMMIMTAEITGCFITLIAADKISYKEATQFKKHT